MRQSFLSRKSGLNAKDETRSLFMCSCLFMFSFSVHLCNRWMITMELKSVIPMHGWKTLMVQKQWYMMIFIYFFEECYCWFFTQKNHLHFIPCHVVFVTQAFVEEQNKLTMPYLEQCAIRAQFHQRLTEVYNYPKYSCPYKRGKR